MLKWKKVGEFLTETYVEKDEPTKPRQGHSEDSGAQQENRTLPHEEFERRLKALSSGRISVIAGKVHFLNLNKLQENLKGDWEAVLGTIHAITEVVLTNRLSKGDFFTRAEGNAYVIVFERLSEEEANLRCCLLAQEILQRLLGESGTFREIQVMAAATKVDGEIEFKQLDILNTIVEALLRAEANLVACDPDGEDGDPKAGGLPDAFAQLLAQAEKALSPEMGEGFAFSDGTTKSDEMPNWTQQTSSRATEDPDSAGTDPQAEPHDTNQGGLVEDISSVDLCVSYRPLLQVQREVVSGYQALIALKVGSDVFYGGAKLPFGADADWVFLVDRFAIRRVIFHLNETLKASLTNTIVVPVNISTLTRSKTLREYISIIASAPEGLRRLLVFEIIDSSSGSWYTQLTQVVSALKRYCRAVTFRVGDDMSAVAHASTAGVYAVGFDLQEEHWPETAAIQKFENFVGRAGRYGLKTFVHNLDTTSLATAAVCAGFEHIDGDAIMPTVDLPQGVIPLDITKLFSRTAETGSK